MAFGLSNNGSYNVKSNTLNIFMAWLLGLSKSVEILRSFGQGWSDGLWNKINIGILNLFKQKGEEVGWGRRGCPEVLAVIAF